MQNSDADVDVVLGEGRVSLARQPDGELVDLNTKQLEKSQYQRSDICAVPAASVVDEHIIAFEIARALRAKFGGDSMTELRAQHAASLWSRRLHSDRRAPCASTRR